MLLFAITVLKQDANALMLGEFPVVMDLVGSVEAAKEAKQQVVIMVMVMVIMVMRIVMVRIVMVMIMVMVIMVVVIMVMVIMVMRIMMVIMVMVMVKHHQQEQ